MSNAFLIHTLMKVLAAGQAGPTNEPPKVSDSQREEALRQKVTNECKPVIELGRSFSQDYLMLGSPQKQIEDLIIPTDRKDIAKDIEGFYASYDKGTLSAYEAARSIFQSIEDNLATSISGRDDLTNQLGTGKSDYLSLRLKATTITAFEARRNAMREGLTKCQRASEGLDKFREYRRRKTLPTEREYTAKGELEVEVTLPPGAAPKAAPRPPAKPRKRDESVRDGDKTKLTVHGQDYTERPVRDLGEPRAPTPGVPPAEQQREPKAAPMPSPPELAPSLPPPGERAETAAVTQPPSYDLAGLVLTPQFIAGITTQATPYISAGVALQSSGPEALLNGGGFLSSLFTYGSVAVSYNGTATGQQTNTNSSVDDSIPGVIQRVTSTETTNVERTHYLALAFGAGTNLAEISGVAIRFGTSAGLAFGKGSQQTDTLTTLTLERAQGSVSQEFADRSPLQESASLAYSIGTDVIISYSGFQVGAQSRVITADFQTATGAFGLGIGYEIDLK